MSTVTVNACAKVNLTLRVLGARPDGYHSVQTILQSIALHDALTFRSVRGAWKIECDDPACPTDRTNLVWRAARLVWRAGGRAGQPRDVRVHIRKRIPLQSGLGGGSSDAAAAIRGLAALWRIDLSHGEQYAMAADLGADVPFFLDGGTALGLERGDVLFPLADGSPAWVTLVVPPFGVSTKDAYGWFDQAFTSSSRSRRETSSPRVGPHPHAFGSRLSRVCNDLQPTVVARYPEIARIVRNLRRQGAQDAAMSGSGSAVFGLFGSQGAAEAAVRAFSRRGYRSLATRMLGRSGYRVLTRPRLSSHLPPKRRIVYT